MSLFSSAGFCYIRTAWCGGLSSRMPVPSVRKPRQSALRSRAASSVQLLPLPRNWWCGGQTIHAYDRPRAHLYTPCCATTTTAAVLVPITRTGNVCTGDIASDHDMHDEPAFSCEIDTEYRRESALDI